MNRARHVILMLCGCYAMAGVIALVIIWGIYRSPNERPAKPVPPPPPVERDWRADYMGKPFRVGNTTGTVVGGWSSASVVFIRSDGTPTTVPVDWSAILNQHAPSVEKP